MVDVPDLHSARPNEWLAASTDWQDLGTNLGDIADLVTSDIGKAIDPGAWSGYSAGFAQKFIKDTAQDLEAAHGEINAVSDVLEGLGQAMSVCQRALDEAQQMASQYGLTVNPDGTVSAPSENIFQEIVGELDPFLSLTEHRKASPAQLAQIRELVTDALRRATRADEEAAAELRTIASHTDITDPEAAYGNNDTPNADGLTASRLELQMIYQSIPSGPPSLVSKWWSGLPSAQKNMLMQAAPGTIGVLPGIPASVQARLRGPDGINRVALINYALDNVNNTSDDVDGDNCTNFVSDALLAAGLRETSSHDEDSNNSWYKTLLPGIINKFPLAPGRSIGGENRSRTWADASDLHAFLTHNGSTEVPYAQAQPGDIVFYKDNSDGIYHAAVVTATLNGQIFYTQHTPGEQNASWGSRQSLPDYTNPQNPTTPIIVRPGQDNAPPPPYPDPQPGPSPSPPSS